MPACIWFQSNKLLILDSKSFRSTNSILAFLPQSIIRPSQTLFECYGIHWSLAKTLNLMISSNPPASNASDVFPFSYCPWEDGCLGSSQWRVKLLVRGNNVLPPHRQSIFVRSDMSVQRPSPPKQTYIRLSAPILLCCSGCQRTVRRLMLYTVMNKVCVSLIHWWKAS